MRHEIVEIKLRGLQSCSKHLLAGNIRELQNLVERAVILSRDGVLQNPLHKNQTDLIIPSRHRTRTFHALVILEDSDRALILETLEQARAKCSGMLRIVCIPLQNRKFHSIRPGCVRGMAAGEDRTGVGGCAGTMGGTGWVEMWRFPTLGVAKAG